MKYLLVIEDAGENLSAYFPDVPGCVALGDSVEQVRASAKEVLAFHLEEEQAPEPRTLQAVLASGELDDADGTEVFAWVTYDERSALSPA